MAAKAGSDRAAAPGRTRDDVGLADARVRERARSLGFEAVAVARADVPLDDDFARYRAFLDAEMHDGMPWLADHAEVRRALDGEGILAGAKSVVCLARRYQREADEEDRDPPLARRIARYARGRDYHVGMRKKLRKLAAFVRTLGGPDAPVRARPIADDAPVLERAWAARAGLGFVGKNGLLIVPGHGSMVLLGEVVTTLALTPDSPIDGRCGACTRCLDACPTGAFERPFVLDPRRCVAYLTIEHRGAVPVALREAIGEHLFGCDDCQTVCPFNGARQRDAGAKAPFEPLPRWSELALTDLLALDDGAWARVAEGTPIHRATRDGLARNAALVLGHAEGRAERAAAIPSLRAAAAEHPSPIVRDAASWALGRIDRVIGVIGVVGAGGAEGVDHVQGAAHVEDVAPHVARPR